jgi:hypothetical protein
MKFEWNILPWQCYYADLYNALGKEYSGLHCFPDLMR